MKVRFFNPGLWYKDHKKEIDSEISRVLSAGDLILREDVEKFEENLANFVGTKYAVALNSGTDAIYLSLKTLHLEGKRVAVPSHTFKSTCGAIINAGAIPVVYDMNGYIVGDDAIGHNDVGITVHIAGELSPIRKDAWWPVIEDACQALGAVKNPSSYAQCWSFYPAKILGAVGDAGAITTNNFSTYEYIKEARNHFKGDNRDFGINSRCDNLQAAFLNVKFKYIDGILNRRQQVADMYYEKLTWDFLGMPSQQSGRVYQDFIIRTERRNELYNYLKEQGIETMKNEYPWSPDYPKLPLAAKYEAETLRIPCNENLNDREVNEVIEKINGFFK